jgi:hypothetical protein
LTDDVTLANSAPGKPNRSAINQVRTNEIALAFPWQLREFTLQGAASNLLSATIKQTPDPGLFRIGSGVTADFMEANKVAISCERHVVPAEFYGQSISWLPRGFWLWHYLECTGCGNSRPRVLHRIANCGRTHTHRHSAA